MTGIVGSDILHSFNKGDVAASLNYGNTVKVLYMYNMHY